MERTLKDHCTIHYEDKGLGKALVFLHGNGEDGSRFRFQMDRFSTSWRVILPDARGHGRSGRGTGPLTLPRMAEDLRELLKGLGLDAYILIGFSDGANVAMEAASGDCPGLEALVLAGGNLRPRGMKLLALLGVLGEALAALVPSLFSERWRRKLERTCLMLLEPRIPFRKLGEIRVPTLVLAGDRDLIREGETRKIAGLIPESTLRILSGADHFFVYGQPERFAGILESWFCGIINGAQEKETRK